MIRVPRAGIAATGTAALIAAALLYHAGSTSGERSYDAVIEGIAALKDQSTAWSIEVARVRTNPLADFDTLTAFSPRINALQKQVKEETRQIDDLEARIDDEIHAFINAISAQEERIERFKTTYAVVRNSARYLPLSAANAVKLAQSSGDEKLAQTISRFVQDIAAHSAAPSAPARRRLEAEIDVLKSESVSRSIELANAIANLLSHSSVLITREGPMNELLTKATEGGISEQAKRLNERLGNAGRNAREKAESTKTAGYGFGALALALWVWAGTGWHKDRSRVQDTSAAQERETTGAEITKQELVQAQTKVEEAERKTRALEQAHEASEGARQMTLHAEHNLRKEHLLRHTETSILGTGTRIGQRVKAAELIADRLMNQLNGLGEEEDPQTRNDIEQLAAITSQIKREGETMTNLARRLKATQNGAAVQEEREMIDLRQCAEEVARALKVNIRITGDAEGQPDLFAVRSEMRLMLKEIIENSARAIEEVRPRAGSIKLDVRERGESAQITLIDNGNAIEPGMLGKIFQPFYTSHANGAGVGLSVVSEIVKSYDGKIKVNSLKGQGTVMRITLPNNGETV